MLQGSHVSKWFTQFCFLISAGKSQVRSGVADVMFFLEYFFFIVILFDFSG